MSQQSVYEIDTDTTVMEEPSSLPPIQYGLAERSDVILVVQGQEFHVDKATLASRSKYFNAMFFGNFKESTENRIVIQEVSRIAFKRLMNFVYHGRIMDNYSALTFFVTTDGTHGELKLKHCLIRNKEGHIKNFFKASNEMLQLADRFDIKEDFQVYFQTLLDYHTCTTASCFVCLTIHIFGIANNLHFTREKYRKYDYKFVKEWLRFAKLAKINLDGTDVVFRLFELLG